MVSRSAGSSSRAAIWPELPLEAWQETYATLHMWTQIVGKIRLAQMPYINHSWHVTQYVTARGLTTSPIPRGQRAFEIDFDFIDHLLVVRKDDGATREVALVPRSVADFHDELFAKLGELDLDVRIHGSPNEVEKPIPFAEDREHASYDADYANRFWRILVQSDRLFREFRARFLGKVSPVHFFWGSFDLAVTRFSGREAPPHPGGVPNLPDWVAREAYSHEVSSAGFWPGGGPLPYPLFYSYHYPEPDGYRGADVRQDAALFSEEMGEYVLPYEAVRTAEDPDEMVLDFLESTYRAGAEAADWDIPDFVPPPQA
jgi:hypothetical protein